MKAEQVELKDQGEKAVIAPRQRAPRASLVPIQQDFEAIDLETSFLEDSHHHRWLLTTCIAGIAATLLIGGVTLGIFGQNAVPNGANAAISENAGGGQLSKVLGNSNIQTASTGPAVLPQRSLQGDWSYPEVDEGELPYGEQETAVLDAEIEAVESENENITTITKSPPPEPVDEKFKLEKGRNIAEELTERGVSKAVAQSLVKSIEPVLPVRLIKAGTEFEVTLDRQYDFYGREVIFPVELSFKPGPKETIVVESDEDGRFAARVDGKDGGVASQYAEIPNFVSRNRIGSSLYTTAKDNGVPDYIVSEFTRIFAYDVDLQRQLEPSDSYEMFFGKPLTGSSSKRKVLHYATLTYDGKTKTYYRFTTSDGRTDYYDENGRSASRALLKTPISGARLTSGFGMRRHPLLGYSKMHTGVDFGAPTGTPIRSSGAGVVDLAGRHGAYGIAVVLKHGSKYKTLYAHMSRLAAGIRSGVPVNQGQIIGYVGTTGRSTGPHLHYEVRVNNRPVNPTTIKATGGRQLAGKDLQNFRVTRNRVVAMMKSAPSSSQVAQAGQ
ncbi:MAG: peptidoglycan DD-metalloendopeptidase family protein [Rhizobiales bacterium]|nr:peptidoglycan DD-metalloendopeptidase family protein [Hyphomicrobiales bacterium]